MTGLKILVPTEFSISEHDVLEKVREARLLNGHTWSDTFLDTKNFRCSSVEKNEISVLSRLRTNDEQYENTKRS